MSQHYTGQLPSCKILRLCDKSQHKGTIVNSLNTDLNSAWMAMGLRSVFDESTITLCLFGKILRFLQSLREY